MSIGYNPSIALPGNLVLLNDGANPRSPAFGNTTLTLDNGLSAPSNGYYTFDGVDDAITINNPSGIYNTSWTNGKTIVVSAWMTSGVVYSGAPYYRAMIGGVGGRITNFYIYVDATGYRLHFSAGSPIAGSLSSYLTVSTQTWYIWGITQASDGTVKYWQNGNIVSTTSQTLGGYVAATEYLGRADNLWLGRIGVWQVYNTCLTDAQMIQNFEALRGRYGI
jgi:hypothetical protein